MPNENIIDFRDDRVQAEWSSGNVDPLLSKIFLYAARYSYDFLNRTLLITCIWRSEAEDLALNGSGVHKVWRAIDVHADTWQDPVIGQLADWINARWIYDPLRTSMRVALWEPHGTGPHLHVQTCHSGITTATGVPVSPIPTSLIQSDTRQGGAP